jgi:hypothetical protein
MNPKKVSKIMSLQFEFSNQLSSTSPSAEARETINKFQNWLRVHRPDHPALAFTIMHIDFALEAAGIDKHGSFSTEAAAGCDSANDHCPEDQAKWYAWLDHANALHKCNWAECDESVLSDISEAVRKKVQILVIERIG